MQSPKVFGDSQNGEKSSVMFPLQKVISVNARLGLQTLFRSLEFKSTLHPSAHFCEVEDACPSQHNTEKPG